MTEKELDLQDLFVEILLHWRGIILWTLIGGIVLETFSFIRLPQMITGTQTGKSSLSALKNKMTQIELTEVERALLSEYACRKWQSYMEDSALMQLDASQVYQADLIYAVNTNKKNVDLAKLYENLLSTSYMYNFVASETNSITTSDARELIGVTNSNASVQGMKNPSFRVTVTAGTEKTCYSMSKAVQDYVGEMQKTVRQNYGVSHNIILLQDNITVVCNTDLLQRQVDMRSKINSLQSETANMLVNFSKEQTQYYQIVSENNDNSVNPKKQNEIKTATKTGQVKTADSMSAPARTKYAAMGMLLGMLIYIFPISFKYILDGKLRYTDNCADLYQVPALGYIPAQREPKGPFANVDKWVYRLRNKDSRTIPTEDAAELSAVAVTMAANKKNLNCVYLTGCNLSSEASAKMKEIIQHALTTDGIETQTADNILYHAKSRALLSKAKAAVLIEQAGCALHKEIMQELEILRRQGVEILGMIIIE